MENLIISSNAVMPMFILMFLGYALKRLGLISPEMIPKLNKLNFYVFLSVLSFKNVYQGDLASISSLNIVLFCVAGVLLEYFAGAKLSKRLDPAPNRCAVLMQCFFRTNTMLMALPLASALFDDISVISIVFAFIIPLYNILAVTSFEEDRGGRVNHAGSIIKNPLLIATALGLLANITHLKLPNPVSNVMNTLATVGNGLPLMVLGANFDFSHAITRRRLITTSCIIRLIVQPVIFILIGALLFGYRNIELLAILAVFGCGVPTTTFTMAKEMAGDAELAGEIVVFSNLFSCLTLFLWVFVLKSFSLM